MGFGCGCFARAADSGLGVADDAVVEIDETGLNERSQREDGRGGIASGVGDEACIADFVAMQFWATVDGFGLEDGGALGVGIFELVDVSVGGMVETPRAAEVDDLDAPVDGFGNPLTGLLVRGSEKQDLCSGVDEAFPGEGKELVSPVACDCELGVDV